MKKEKFPLLQKSRSNKNLCFFLRHDFIFKLLQKFLHCPIDNFYAGSYNPKTISSTVGTIKIIITGEIMKRITLMVTVLMAGCLLNAADAGTTAAAGNSAAVAGASLVPVSGDGAAGVFTPNESAEIGKSRPAIITPWLSRNICLSFVHGSENAAGTTFKPDENSAFNGSFRIISSGGMLTVLPLKTRFDVKKNALCSLPVEWYGKNPAISVPGAILFSIKGQGEVLSVPLMVEGYVTDSNDVAWVVGGFDWKLEGDKLNYQGEELPFEAVTIRTADVKNKFIIEVR